MITKNDIGKRVISNLYNDEVRTNYGRITAVNEEDDIVEVRVDNLNGKSEGKLVEYKSEVLVFDYDRDEECNIIFEDNA